jgi:hypothetical protein
MNCHHHSGCGHHSGHGFTGSSHHGGCGHHAGHGSTESSHHGGCCCTSGHGNRHFFTQEEMIKHLEDYLKQLQSEAKGVEEHIEKLKKGTS